MIYTKRADTYDGVSYKIHGGDVYSLIGASVLFIMETRNGHLLVKSPGVIDAVDNKLTYAFKGADTIVTGIHRAEFQVTFADGKVKTFPENGYISVTIAENINSDRVTEVEENIAIRVSLIETYKSEINATVEGFQAEVDRLDATIVEANSAGAYAETQAIAAETRIAELNGVDATQFKERQDTFDAQLDETVQ